MVRRKNTLGTMMQSFILKNPGLWHEDIGEKHNVAVRHPELVKELAAKLEAVCANPKSRP